MNVLDTASQEKLLRGMRHLLDTAGVLPPIVVRPHPNPVQGQYQIIDGEHRWRVLKETGTATEIDGYVLDVDDKTAMILTDTLNYLRGSPDVEKYGDYLQALLQQPDMSLDLAASFLPETKDELQALLDSYEIHIETIDVGDGDKTEEEDALADAFMELKFTVSRSQAEVIEQELARIAGLLTGKNLRGRALEYMAVNSAQTPTNNLMGESAPVVEDAPPEDVDSKKRRLKKRAAS
jgi:ParB-like chromosome segregation protein Spo0J